MSGTAALEIILHSIKQLLLQHVKSSSSASSCSSHPLLLLQWEFNTGSHCRSEGIYEASALVLYTKNAPPRSRLPRSVAQIASPGTPVTPYNTWTNRKALLSRFQKGNGKLITVGLMSLKQTAIYYCTQWNLQTLPKNWKKRKQAATTNLLRRSRQFLTIHRARRWDCTFPMSSC
jgi:hypothetical protein